MSVEENKVIVRRLMEEVWNKENLAITDELFATSFVSYLPGSPDPLNREGYKQVLTMFRTAFPDMRLTIEDQVSEGDKVVTRWTVRGTHRGDFQGIPPTQKQVTVTGMTIDCIVLGKIVENRIEFDQLGMMQQLGVVPSPTQGR